MTNVRYEAKRRAIAQREWNKLRTSNPVMYSQYNSYESWYRDSFLVDLIWLDLILNEIGSEEDYDQNNAIESGETGNGDPNAADVEESTQSFNADSAQSYGHLDEYSGGNDSSDGYDSSDDGGGDSGGSD